MKRIKMCVVFIFSRLIFARKNKVVYDQFILRFASRFCYMLFEVYSNVLFGCQSLCCFALSVSDFPLMCIFCQHLLTHLLVFILYFTSKLCRKNLYLSSVLMFVVIVLVHVLLFALEPKYTFIWVMTIFWSFSCVK